MAVAQRENADPELVESLSNELQVTPQTPPTFLFHTTSDPVVPVGNSVLFYMALRKAGVPAEMHIYEEGPHGRRPGRRRSGALLLAGAPGCLDAVVRRLSSPPKIAAVGAIPAAAILALCG